jgi:hypothetical protein
MGRYVKNRIRMEAVERFGQTAGLPLFEAVGPRIPKRFRTRLENAAKSMPLATDTRNLARIAQTSDPVELGDKQQKVLDAIRDLGAPTNAEIARHLDWPINRVTGRTFELRQYGLVAENGKRACSVTRRIVATWQSK